MKGAPKSQNYLTPKPTGEQLNAAFEDMKGKAERWERLERMYRFIDAQLAAKHIVSEDYSNRQFANLIHGEMRIK
jgi:hypothetical protein